MFNNAMHYNKEGSLIYNVSIQIIECRLDIYKILLECEKIDGCSSTKAHELGYDEHRPRLKEARVNITMVIN